jgi:amino acid adenylation domain-containing protein
VVTLDSSLIKDLSEVHFNLETEEVDDYPYEHTFIHSHSGQVKQGLYFELDVKGDEIYCRVEYKNSIYDLYLIESLVDGYKELVSSAKSNLNKNILTIPLLNSEKSKQILTDWNDTSASYPKDKTIYQLFEQQVKKNPDNIAIVFEDQKLSYKELNQKSNQLARFIRAKYKKQNKKDLTPDSLIGLCIERSLDMIIGILGILKAGGAYVPLDPDYPQDRLEYMIEDSHEGLIITQKDILSKAGFLDKIHLDELLVIDSDDVKADLLKQSADNLEQVSGPSSLAYVIYTSGSTGKPKGVMLEHDGVINRINWMHKEYGLNKNDKILQKTPFSFDVSVWELLWAITYGGQLVFAKPEGHKDPGYLLESIEKYGITKMHFVPSMLQVFMGYIEAGNLSFSKLSSLKDIFCSGEALPLPLAKMVLDKLSLKLNNLYGPTEASIDVTFYDCAGLAKSDLASVPIGKSIDNTQLYILNKNLTACPMGAQGELYIGGAGLARGYLNQEELTKERFITNPFVNESGSSQSDRIYKTGDLVRWLPDGNVEYLGRNDFQVKIRGFRIELGEIENVLAKHGSISQVSVIDKEKEGQKYLAAYYVIAKDTKAPEIDHLKFYLSETLPDYMVPTAFVKLDEMPLTPNGKINRRALPEPDMSLMGEEYVAASDDIEEKLIQIWQEILKLEKIGIYDQFFNLGGNSLLTIQLQSKIKDAFNIDLSIADIFQYPTVFAFAEFVRGKLGVSKKTKEKQVKKVRRGLGSDQAGSRDIAIIGLACLAPGADNHKEFWKNLENSVESIRDLTDEELLLANIDEKLLNDANYVRRGGFVDNLEFFDARFFEYTPLEAKSIDPQMRHFFECAWSALEDSGVIMKRSELSVGVYSGKGYNQYLMDNIMNSPDVISALGLWGINVNNHYLSSKVSYHFNLDGPSVDINTACSTGLVSVKLAIDGILNGECDIALAGGVTLNQEIGYLYQEGMIASPDGHCRAFDEKAKGTVDGSAVGVLVLKHLDDALADNDQIYAVIKDTAINNDGSTKVGYTAPSVEGQSNVIRDAIEKSGIDPETISFIEAHGTATPLGDPIEISALTQAYRNFTDKKQYVAIGSVKTNIGHTDTAAGVMGLIKTALALKHKKIPASLHFNKANPEIDFENSPFFVNTELREWEVPEGIPRRAGVSSFGIGGTNAHAILEEAPERSISSESRKQQLFLLSAKTDTSVSAYADKLANFLKENKADIKLSDVAYTLQVGRDSLKHRRCYVSGSFDQAIDVLGKKAVKAQTGEILQEGVTPEIIFMFSGQGAQYVNMARGLYEQELSFKEVVDQCCGILKYQAGLDLLEVLYPENKGDIKVATDKITRTNYAQPALFVIEYALAKLLMHWGVKPKAMIGHSVGEYIAATIAGVFELKDALLLVATRGKLMHGMPAGSMLSVNLEEAKLKDLLPKDLSLAAVNSPSLSVVSGERKAIKDFKDKLDKKDISCTLLHTSHAFHSPMMQGAANEFLKIVKKVKKDAPKIGFVSNLTGNMITKEQAVSDQYWVDHLLNAVLFDKGVSQLLTDKLSCLVEIGPGRTLSTFALQNKTKSKSHHILTSVRHIKNEMDDLAMLLNLVGRLWVAGIEINYTKFYEQEKRNKISIPTYCFDHERYWVEPQKQELAQGSHDALLAKNPDITQWFYEPNWEKKRLLLNEDDSSIRKGHVLILGDSLGLSGKIIKALAKCDYSFIKVLQGDKFAQKDKHNFVINPNNFDDYGKLVQAIKDEDIDLKFIIHTWQFTDKFDSNLTIENVETDLEIGYYSLLSLMKSLFSHGFMDKMSCKVLGNHVSNVLDGELTSPQKGMIQALVQVIPQEYSQVKCQHIDVTGINLDNSQILNNVCNEITSESSDRIVAYRDKQRWIKKYTKLELPKQTPKPVLLKDKGVYLITGGLGNVGLLMANYISKRVKANIILMGRSEFLAEDAWSSYLKENEADANDITAFKIKRLQEIKALGSEVRLVRADVSDQGQIADVLTKLKQEYGEINGVIHSAGALNKDLFLPLNETDNNNCEKHFQPKVQGTLSLSNALNEVLADKPLDFCILMSSLSAVIGGLDFSAYSAVNYFLDHFADLNQASPNKFTSIDWDGWLSIEADDSWEYSISGSEGDQLFNYLLTLINAGLHQFVVSTGDLDTRIARTDLSALSDIEQEEAVKVENASDIKVTVSNIWKEILGVEDVDDDDDDFFELGGHSLLATQLIGKLRKIFGIDLSVKFVFENKALSEMVSAIDLMLSIKSGFNGGSGDGEEREQIDL